MSNIIVGAITGYDWDQIKFWINSLNNCGYDGQKILMCHNIDQNTMNKITGHGVQVCVVGGDVENVCVDRFKWYWQLLNLLNEDPNSLIVATDVRDVVFQSDPIKWIENNVYTPKVILSSEGIKYKDEVWGRNNFYESYGSEGYEQVANNVIINAGVMAGKISYIKDLFLQIYLTSRAAAYQHVPGGGGPDQAAYNLLMGSKPWYDSSRLASVDSGWAAQLGAMGPQTPYQQQGVLVGNTPTFDGDFVNAADGSPYAIVHQYDRVPCWKQSIEEKYS